MPCATCSSCSPPPWTRNAFSVPSPPRPPPTPPVQSPEPTLDVDHQHDTLGLEPIAAKVGRSFCDRGQQEPLPTPRSSQERTSSTFDTNSVANDATRSLLRRGDRAITCSRTHTATTATTPTIDSSRDS